MRILTFLHSFEPGGVERIALRLVRAWRQDGADAPLLMGRSDGAMRAELADVLRESTRIGESQSKRHCGASLRRSLALGRPFATPLMAIG